MRTKRVTRCFENVGVASTEPSSKLFHDSVDLLSFSRESEARQEHSEKKNVERDEKEKERNKKEPQSFIEFDSFKVD
jgi:hypothetical protein